MVQSELSAREDHAVLLKYSSGHLDRDGIGVSGSKNNFAMTAGGGIDVKVSGHLSVRPIQAEHFLTKRERANLFHCLHYDDWSRGVDEHLEAFERIHGFSSYIYLTRRDLLP